MAGKATRAKVTKKTADPKRVTLIEIRVPPDLMEQIDAEAARLTAERHGEPVTRSEVVRLLIREAFALRKPKK